MRAYEFESQDLPSVERARRAIPQILARAQQDYDAWDEEDRDTYAGGGICHIIADSVCDVLSDAGIECTSVSCSHEQHVYVAARFAEGIYTIDIPYHIYEQGGGFSWKKLPDVRFEPRDVVFYRVSGDPDDWRDYLDEQRTYQQISERVDPVKLRTGWQDQRQQGRWLLRAHGEDDQRLIISVHDTQDRDREVGFVRFVLAHRPQDREPFVRAGFVFVNPDQRGQGLARLMYQYANDLGQDIEPSASQTEKGQAMWKKMGGQVRRAPPVAAPEPRRSWYQRLLGRDPEPVAEGLRDITNFVRNIGSDPDAPIVMMTNPQNTGARTASGQRMRIEDFPLRTVAVSELRPWEPMIKMRDLPSQRTVASLIKTLRQGGRIPPLLVTPVRGGYRIIDGHHRYAALQRAGVEHTPVRVVDPRLIRYSDEVREALKITLERYGHLAVKEQANPKGEIKLGPQLFVSRQTTTEDIKPRGVAWTSTAQKTPQGFTSDWVEWCKDNMAQWVTDTGILYDVAPGARILLLRTDRDVIQVARRYGLEIKNSFDLFEKMDWDVLRQDYDAVHHIPQGRDPFMSAWDVESTAWFDRKFLTNPRRVTVDTGKTHDIGETGKPGVAESLDQPYRIKWERSPFGDLDAIATLEDGSNLLIMFNNEVYQWRVEFYRGDRQDITGEGDAQRIFATVLKAIREFIRRKKPISIVFGSVKEIDPRGSRTRLYDRMVQRYADDLGYTLHRQQDSAHTVYRLDRQQDVAEGLVNETQTVTRIDSKPITDFASELRAYKHTDDWSQSGIDTGDNSYWRKNNLQVKTTKGLFAGDPKRTALYATGNAHETRYVEFTRNGKSYVYFAAEDVPRFKNRKTYLSVFDAKNFRKLPTGEYFSENPGAPIKQIEITDPFAYIQKQGWNVRITRDLDKVFQQVKDMHQRGKIPYYGGEGMSESQQGVAEGQLDEIYKMPPTKNSSQGMTVWAYNDAIEKKSPVVYRGNDVIIFAANENLLRYIRLQDGKPVLYIGFTRFLDGYKSGTVATEMSGRGKGLAKQAYLDASDILKAPIYSDSTQTDASRLGIWDKLIQQYPDRVVGFDQKNNQNLSLSMTDRGPVVNQNQPIYVDRNKKDSAKPVAPNQRYRTRILKLLPVRQGVAEGIDPDTFEELDARIIARAAKRIVPTARARRTPEGYVHVTTPDGLDLFIGASVADGVINVNIGSGGGVTTSGANKGAVTEIIRGVYDAAVRKYGRPDTPGELTIDYDAGHGVWQHIADKLGLRYAAVEVKESGMAEGRISDLDQDLQDQQWEAVVGRVEHGVRRGEDPDGMSLALYQWATGEMFDMDEELERRGFDSVADLRDHIRDHGGRYVPPKFDLSAAGSIKDIQRLPRRRPDDVSEATSEPDFMRGHCHVMALALLTLHPDWQLRAHIGWEEDAESDSDYRVDHVYVVAPDGTAYDCRGRFSSEQELVGPDETGGTETQFVDYDISRVRADIARGELRPFGRRDLEQARTFAQRIDENFADGRKPGRKGLSKRVGIPRKATLGQLEKIAKSSTGERRRMAQWQLNMRRGQKKNK